MNKCLFRSKMFSANYESQNAFCREYNKRFATEKGNNGITPATLSSYLNNKGSTPTVKTIENFGMLLGLSKIEKAEIFFS